MKTGPTPTRVLGIILLTGIVALVVFVVLSGHLTSGSIARPTPAPSSLKPTYPNQRGLNQWEPNEGYPDQANTGYENAPGYPGSLTGCSGLTIRSNETYKFCNFSNGLDVGNSSTVLTNVTFIGCRFANNSVSDADVAVYSENVSFQYDTFEPNTVPMGFEPVSPYATAIANIRGNQYGIDQRHAGTLSIDHSDFWGFADAIQFSYSSRAEPVTISHSWFHNPRSPLGVSQASGDHTDGILDPWGGISYVAINNNTIVGDGNTQAVALQGATAYDHIWITNNYLSGYGYMVCIGANAKDTNVTFAGNVWSSEFEPAWGPLYSDVNFVTAGLGNTWRGNTYHVASGTTWLAKGNNGLYWWPSDIAATGQYSISTSRIIGHANDYTGP